MQRQINRSCQGRCKLIFDVHAHFYPDRLLKQFESLGKYGFEMERDASGNRVLSRHGKLVATYTDAFHSIDKRLEVMARGKVDLQALSVVQPGVFWAEPELGLSLCQLINDEIYQIVKEYPDHFVGIASVPLQDVERAVKELDRAVLQLWCKGVAMGTNINGMDLDAPQLFPFYQRVAELGIPIFVHPFAWGWEKDVRLLTYRLDKAILGFMFDNIIAISRVILGGVLEKYPNLKFRFTHLGGGLPYLIGRIDKGASIYPETRAKISQPPSFYLRKIYLDTAYFYGPALNCALACVSDDHIVFGTDYPFAIGDSPEVAVSQLQRHPTVSESLIEKIFSENPARLLGLQQYNMKLR